MSNPDAFLAQHERYHALLSPADERETKVRAFLAFVEMPRTQWNRISHKAQDNLLLMHTNANAAT